MIGPLIRISLRFLSGFLIAKGWMAPEIGVDLANDPDVQQVAQVAAGIAAGVIAECWYFFARRLGWAR